MNKISRHLEKQIWSLFQNTYVALHVDDPGENGKSELNIQRQLLQLNDDGTNKSDIVFRNMPAIGGKGYGFMGVWTSPRGGEFLQGQALKNRRGNVARFTANDGDDVIIPAGTFRIRL